MLSVIMLSVIMLIVNMLSAIIFCVMLSFIMLSVIMFCVVMLDVVAPLFLLHYGSKHISSGPVSTWNNLPQASYGIYKKMFTKVKRASLLSLKSSYATILRILTNNFPV